jgi:hypothetical protein
MIHYRIWLNSKKIEPFGSIVEVGDDLIQNNIINESIDK